MHISLAPCSPPGQATPRVVLPRFDLRTFLSVVQERKVTFAFIVPPILLALAKSPLVDEYDISSLWRVASGAASLADELAQKVYRRLGIRATDGEQRHGARSTAG